MSSKIYCVLCKKLIVDYLIKRDDGNFCFNCNLKQENFVYNYIISDNIKLKDLKIYLNENKLLNVFIIKCFYHLINSNFKLEIIKIFLDKIENIYLKHCLTQSFFHIVKKTTPNTIDKNQIRIFKMILDELSVYVEYSLMEKILVNFQRINYNCEIIEYLEYRLYKY